MNELRRVFDYEGRRVRTVMIDDESWFVTKDVCDVLGLEQVSRAMDRLDEDERGLVKVTHPQSPDKTIEVNATNEAGLLSACYGIKQTRSKTV